MKVILKKLSFILISEKNFSSNNYNLIINESILSPSINKNINKPKPKCNIKKYILLFIIVSLCAITIFVEFYYKD